MEAPAEVALGIERETLGPSFRSKDFHVLPSPKRLTAQYMRETHARLFEDVVFDEAKWERHRSSWFRHKVEPGVFLRVAIGFIWQILWVELVSVAVGLYSIYLVPQGCPPVPPSLAQQLFTVLTFALSLLLVFKTNSSFARWWEGRIIWGQIVNFARNYTRLLLAWAPEEKQHVARAAVRWASAAPHVLRGYIRQMKGEAHQEASHLLRPDELGYLSTWTNPPAGCARAMSFLISELHLAPEQQAQLEDQVTLYVNMAGGCERIYKTPIPAPYTRHTSRFLMIFLTAAPILLWPAAQWATPFIMAFVAFLLIGTENIGAQIEEPFHVLPLDAICNAIEANLKELERQYLDSPQHLGWLRRGMEGESRNKEKGLS